MAYEGGFGGFESYGGGDDYGMNYGGGMDPMGDVGGFLNDGNDSAKKGDKKGKSNESMFPLTVKQVEKATPSDNGYEIYGINISTVKIMGFIEHSEEHATNKTYVINDGTGAIQCILYTTENVPTFSNYTYVKVFGNIRSLEGTTKLYVFHMSEVTVLDEMTYHILDCIHNFCKLTKQDKNATVFRGLTTPQGNFGKQSIKNESTSSGTKDAVLQAIANAGTSEEGVSIELICRALQNKYSRDEIRKHCADLCDEGSIYSTIDEDHFLASG